MFLNMFLLQTIVKLSLNCRCLSLQAMGHFSTIIILFFFPHSWSLPLFHGNKTCVSATDDNYMFVCVCSPVRGELTLLRLACFSLRHRYSSSRTRFTTRYTQLVYSVKPQIKNSREFRVWTMSNKIWKMEVIAIKWTCWIALYTTEDEYNWIYH